MIFNMLFLIWIIVPGVSSVIMLIICNLIKRYIILQRNSKFWRNIEFLFWFILALVFIIIFTVVAMFFLWYRIDFTRKLGNQDISILDDHISFAISCIIVSFLVLIVVNIVAHKLFIKYESKFTIDDLKKINNLISWLLNISALLIFLVTFFKLLLPNSKFFKVKLFCPNKSLNHIDNWELMLLGLTPLTICLGSIKGTINNAMLKQEIFDELDNKKNI